MATLFSCTFRAFTPQLIRHGWAWGAWTVQDPIAVESLTDLTELPRLLRSYSRAVAPMIRLTVGDRFNVTAFGTRSGRAYGRDQWIWDPELLIFRAHGQPFVPGMKEARQIQIQRATPLLPVDTAV